MSKTCSILNNFTSAALALMVACGAPTSEKTVSNNDAQSITATPTQQTPRPTLNAIQRQPQSNSNEVTGEAPQAVATSGAYLNFRDGKLSAVVPFNKTRFNEIQDTDPDRTTLELARLPKINDWVALEKSIPADSIDALYTLEGMIENSWENPERGNQILFLTIMINTEETYIADLALDSSPIHIKVNDIKPVDGKINIMIMIKCQKTGVEKLSWLAASKVGLYRWQLAKQ